MESTHSPPRPLKIGELSRRLQLPAYVLRYWETEFKQLRPKRNPAGQRLYSFEDVALVQRIMHLLYERHFTIAGARSVLARNDGKPSDGQPCAELLERVADELRRLRAALGG